MGTVVYLVRHGETEWNRASKIQGQLDIGLSEVGLRQASYLSGRLSKVAFDAIYSSDLSRALVTAETIAKPHGLEVCLAREFREINFGEWQGMGWSEINEKYPGSQDMLRADPDRFRPPGGETWPEVASRVMAGMQRVCKEWPEGKVAVVSHGGSGRMAICSILGVDLRNRWKIRMDNTGITILAHNGEDWTVEAVNDTSHLDGVLFSGHDD